MMTKNMYIQDELSGRIAAVDPIVLQQINDKGGWVWSHTHENGVQMWEDSLGRRAMQVEAESEKEARELFEVAKRDAKDMFRPSDE